MSAPVTVSTPAGLVGVAALRLVASAELALGRPPAALAALGVRMVARPGPHALHLIVGNDAEAVAAALRTA